MPPATVGVIGLGAIGRPVASCLVRAGFDVVVHDVRSEAVEALSATAMPARSAKEVSERCEAVVVAVATDEQALEVLREGFAERATTFVLLSTISLAALSTAGDLAIAAGCVLVDCGVSGGAAAAERGSLVAMVGGTADDVARVRPLLDAFCSEVVHMGPLGSGLKAKLARNVVQYGSWLAAYEAQRLAEAAGVDLAKLAQVVRASDKLIGGPSTLMFRSTVAPFGENDDPGLVAAMADGARLAHKDLRAALSLGAEVGVELPLVCLAEPLMDAVFGLAP
jgi:3-hydroxyisobutyrate dehydrogenase-like beta-hydroxyacid dehydrogenase